MSDPTTTRRLFSPTSAADRARTGRRLLYAAGAAVVVILVIVLFGPSGESIEKRFTPYGAEGPLRIMPEISIDDGSDPSHQRARIAQPTPPAPVYDVEPENAEQATEAVPVAERPHEVAADATEVDPNAEVVQDVTVEGVGSVELSLPRQTSDQAFVIRKMERPLYPPEASETERRRPEIRIDVAIFLQSDGSISATMITYSEGSAVFERAVLEALAKWEFEPVPRNGQLPAPRWLEMTWRFRSPYILDGETGEEIR